MRPSLQFIDETFDINSCNHYTLSIQCSLDGFSFSVFDPRLAKFILLTSHYLICATPYQLRNEIASVIADEIVLSQNFKKTTISYITPKTLVAPVDFSTNNEKKILEYSFPKERDEQVIKKKLQHNKVHLSFIPEIIYHFFAEKFNNPLFIPPANTLILHGEATNTDTQQLSVFKYNHTLFIAVFNHQNLVAFNSFYAKNENDELFYLLKIAKEMNLPNHTNIILYGDFYEHGSFFQLVKPYFKKVNFAQYSHDYSVSYTFYKKPAHIYLPLLELALCE